MVKVKEVQVKAKEIQEKYNMTYYEVLQRFMFERILKRISVSKYKDNFILKGGLLLSAMFGIDNRTTKDMDTLIKGIEISSSKIVEVLNEILSIDLNDGVKFSIVLVADIRKDDEYGGNKYYIVGRLENLRVNLEIDVSTGDKITPRELKYGYPSIFDDSKILISVYTIETIIAEKLETILRRGTFNSRMKDYYDVYIFYNKMRNVFDIQLFKKAIYNTFEKRDSIEYLNDYEEILENISNSDKVKKLWSKYVSRNKYVDDVDFEIVINSVKDLFDLLDVSKFYIME